MKRIFFLAAFLAVAAASAPALAQPLDLKLARVLSWQKKYDEALTRYRSYLASHPGDSQARLEMGDICLWTKRYDCAREQYEKAAANPKLASALEPRMASLAEAEGDLAASEGYLRKALEADPKGVEPRLKLARILSYEKNYGGAVAEYDRVIELEPASFAALSERADVLSWEGRYAEAVEGYDRALATRFDAEVARQKARVLGWWKKYGRAIEAYDEAFDRSGKKAIELERGGKKAFWNRWTLTAIKRYGELLEEEPGNVEGRFDLGQVEGYAGMWEKSSSNFSSILKDQPWHFRAKDSLEKVEILRKKRALSPSVGWLLARSDDRATHTSCGATPGGTSACSAFWSPSQCWRVTSRTFAAMKRSTRPNMLA